MPISAEYVVRETATNLWRNRLMTIAAVLTVTVSLALVGAALLLKQGASHAEVEWQRGTQVSVFMSANASKSEIQAVGTQLNQLPYVHGCSWRTKAEDYHEAKLLLAASVFSALTVDSTPPSYRCTPAQPQDAQAVINRFKNQPGVDMVVAPIQQIHTMEETIHYLQWGFLGVALVLLLSAAVLILNTIRMAIFARRREVSVMKLVGATNWFIRIPYITEGFIQGLLGSAVAIGFVTALHVWYPFHNVYQLSTSALVGTNIVVLIVGVVIGSVGSAIAIRRFLDV